MAEDNMSQLINTFKSILGDSSNNVAENNLNNSSSSAESSSIDEGNKNLYESNNNLNISPEMINNMANMLKNSNISSNKKDSSTQSESSNTTIDFETVMRLKSLIDSLNTKNDPRSNLLYSLKPYLRKTRQEKLDQYVNLFKITQVADLLNLKKGDKK